MSAPKSFDDAWDELRAAVRELWVEMQRSGFWFWLGIAWVLVLIANVIAWGLP